jgi:hypothetical protein
MHEDTSAAPERSWKRIPFCAHLSFLGFIENRTELEWCATPFPSEGINVTESPFVISFPGVSTAEANRFAADLASTIRTTDREVQVEQRRDRPDTQDFGATLAIILGTASVTAVARGVESWLARHSGAKIQIDKDGTVVASNLDSRDAARIAEAFKPSR